MGKSSVRARELGHRNYGYPRQFYDAFKTRPISAKALASIGIRVQTARNLKFFCALGRRRRDPEFRLSTRKYFRLSIRCETYLLDRKSWPIQQSQASFCKFASVPPAKP